VLLALSLFLAVLQVWKVMVVVWLVAWLWWFRYRVLPTPAITNSALMSGYGWPGHSLASERLDTDARGRYRFWYSEPWHLGNQVPPHVKHAYFNLLATFLNEILQANGIIDTIHLKNVLLVLLTTSTCNGFTKFSLNKCSNWHCSTQNINYFHLTIWFTNANVWGPHMVHSWGPENLRKWKETEFYTVSANFSDFWCEVRWHSSWCTGCGTCHWMCRYQGSKQVSAI